MAFFNFKNRNTASQSSAVKPETAQAFRDLVLNNPTPVTDLVKSQETQLYQAVEAVLSDLGQKQQLQTIFSPYLSHGDGYRYNAYGDSWLVNIPQTKINYAQAIGDPLKNSAVFAVLNYICRTFPEAPPRVYKRDRNGTLQAEYDHPLETLLEEPNENYDGIVLWMGSILSLLINGNSYWLKYRDALGQLKELFYVPHYCIEPQWPIDGSKFISYYEFRPGDGKLYKVLPEDIVHLRYGLDPDNPRKGLSQLAPVLREIFTDNEASNFGAALLKNMGVPSVIISPTSEDVAITKEKAEAIKKRFKDAVTGDNRGEPLIMSAGVRVNTVSLSPQQLDLKMLHRLPEERISAIFGVPAIVAGLGAGLDRSSMSNFHEAREMAYESCIIPLQQILVRQLKRQLLYEFSSVSTKGRVVDFDLSRVRVLQTDENKKAQRIDLAIRGGWMRRSEGRAAMNLPVSEEDDVYLGAGAPNENSQTDDGKGNDTGGNTTPVDPYGRSQRRKKPKRQLPKGRKPDQDTRGEPNVENVRRARGIKAFEPDLPSIDDLIGLDEQGSEAGIVKLFWSKHLNRPEMNTDSFRLMLDEFSKELRKVAVELKAGYDDGSITNDHLCQWLVKMACWVKLSHVAAILFSKQSWEVNQDEYKLFNPVISGQINLILNYARGIAAGSSPVDEKFPDQMKSLISGAWCTYNLARK
jgi:HK97 family phage portal protein